MTATNMCYNFVGFRYSPPLILLCVSLALRYSHIILHVDDLLDHDGVPKFYFLL